MPDDPRMQPGEAGREHRRVIVDTDATEPLEAPVVAGGRAPETVGAGVHKRPSPMRPAEDVTEVPAFCETCNEPRTFRKTTVPLPDPADGSAPLVSEALEGESVWACPVCGETHRDLVAEEAYDFEYSNVGYHVPDEKGEPTTAREASDEGVEPPKRDDVRE